MGAPALGPVKFAKRVSIAAGTAVSVGAACEVDWGLFVAGGSVDLFVIGLVVGKLQAPSSTIKNKKNPNPALRFAVCI
jgi:hypothetical protein